MFRHSKQPAPNAEAPSSDRVLFRRSTSVPGTRPDIVGNDHANTTNLMLLDFFWSFFDSSFPRRPSSINGDHLFYAPTIVQCRRFRGFGPISGLFIEVFATDFSFNIRTSRAAGTFAEGEFWVWALRSL